MQEFLTKTLNLSVTLKENVSYYKELPLEFKGKYSFYDVISNGIHWIGVEPKIVIGLVALRKDRLKIENTIGINCALFLNETTFYVKERLIEEGIPFVYKNKAIYLPFIGCLLLNTKERNIKPVKVISFLTQKIILLAIYEKWNNFTATQVANKLGVTKMSVSRCFDEIEYLNIDILKKKGKSRVICIPQNIKLLINEIKAILRNPVITRYEFEKDLKLKNKAGISALSEYSNINDNNYPTYAVTKKEIAELDVKNKKQAYSDDEIGCVVLELGYFINYNKKSTQDPISVSLSLSEDELKDERIKMSINEMFNEIYVI